VTNIPDAPPEPPDERALAYLDYASEALTRQVATAQIEGKALAFLLLPPPPRAYDRQLIESFIPYFFVTTYEGMPVPEIRYTDKEPDKI
jgi:hypothetical protein